MDTSAEAHSMLGRRDVLKAGSAALAGVAMGLGPRAGAAQTPRRGGAFRVRGYDPPHFDPHAPGGISFKLHTLLSYTHSRLFKHKAGPGVPVGTFTPKPDLVESWSQPRPPVYELKLRRGVRWHNKPPVNGRELVAGGARDTFRASMTA